MGWSNAGGWQQGGWGRVAAATPSYTGPGNLATFTAWRGLRAYSAATIGNACVRLQRSSDNSQKDIVSKADGTLNTSDSFFDGSATYMVIKLYDQTGGGLDLINTSADATNPILSLTGLSSKPTVNFFDLNASTLRNATGFGAVSQPWSASIVYQVNTFAGFARLWADSTAVTGILERSADTIAMQTNSGGFEGIAATDGVPHDFAGKWNGATSRYVIDGGSATTATGPGTDGWASGIEYVGFTGGSNTEAYDLSEIGFKASGLTDTELANLVSNQKTFYGI